VLPDDGHSQFMMDDTTARLAAILAQFTHPVFSRLAEGLDAFEEVLPKLAPHLGLVAPGRLEVREFIPVGTVTMLALPSVEPAQYARHLTAGLLMGNSLVLEPLTNTHGETNQIVDRVSARRVDRFGAG
jgi:hypothetical protein